MSLRTDPLKCLGRECGQAYLCWRHLMPGTQEGQRWGNYDEARRMAQNQECEGYWPVRGNA